MFSQASEKQRKRNIASLFWGRELGERNLQQKWGRSLRSVTTLGYSYDLAGHNGCVNTINFDPSGSFLVSGSDDGTVKIWDIENRGKCLTTLKGHTTNVFSATFLPHSNNEEIVSGGNDSDTRYFNLSHSTCTVYKHHSLKVLQISVNPSNPSSFLTCSADGTIRFFDTRQKYLQSVQQPFKQLEDEQGLNNEPVVPQIFGGGRDRGAAYQDDYDFGSLALDYNVIHNQSWRRQGAFSRRPPVLYSVNWHPFGNLFCVSSAMGDVRLFDQRKLVKNPDQCTVNIYRHSQNPQEVFEVTGSAFSKNGTEIVATNIGNFIYLYDTADPTKIKTIPPPQQAAELNTCQVCGDDQHLLRCARCKSVWYCSQDHQREHWPTHRAVCKNQPAPQEEEQSRSSSNPNTRGPKAMFQGHVSRRTIKGVSFYGPNSEYIITGSDDAHVYIFDKKTGEILNVLEGHKDVVNCIALHPTMPMFASSGIDHEAKIWENTGDYPSEECLAKKKRRWEAFKNVNLTEPEDNGCQMQ